MRPVLVADHTREWPLSATRASSKSDEVGHAIAQAAHECSCRVLGGIELQHVLRLSSFPTVCPKPANNVLPDFCDTTSRIDVNLQDLPTTTITSDCELNVPQRVDRRRNSVIGRSLPVVEMKPLGSPFLLPESVVVLAELADAPRGINISAAGASHVSDAWLVLRAGTLGAIKDSNTHRYVVKT